MSMPLLAGARVQGYLHQGEHVENQASLSEPRHQVFPHEKSGHVSAPLIQVLHALGVLVLSDFPIVWKPASLSGVSHGLRPSLESFLGRCLCHVPKTGIVLAEGAVRELEMQHARSCQPLAFPTLSGELNETPSEGTHAPRTPQSLQRVPPVPATSPAPVLDLVFSPAISIQEAIEAHRSCGLGFCVLLWALALREEKWPDARSPRRDSVGHCPVIHYQVRLKPILQPFIETLPGARSSEKDEAHVE